MKIFISGRANFSSLLMFLKVFKSKLISVYHVQPSSLGTWYVSLLIQVLLIYFSVKFYSSLFVGLTWF